MVYELYASYQKPEFYDRLCRVIITLKDGSIIKKTSDLITKEYEGLDVSALHCVIKAQRNLLQSKQYGEITIYNLEPNTERQILADATKVTIEAGYNNPDLYGTIITADVIQALRGKSSPVDYFVKLRFITDNDWLIWGITNFTARRGTNYRDLLNLVATNSNPKLEVDESKMAEDWGTETSLIRGKSFFGTTNEIIKEIGNTTNSIIRIEGGKVYATQLKDDTDKKIKAFELNYKTGLIGQPTQNKEGVVFRTLLNPNLMINDWVHINNGYILQEERDIGNNAVGLDLDCDGLYRIISQTYSLDTRGNDWYIDCQGITQAGVTPTMLLTPDAKGI